MSWYKTHLRCSGPRSQCLNKFYANVASGFIVSVFEADSKEKLEQQMEVLGFPIDETHEVHFAASRSELEQMLKQHSK